MEQGKQAQSVLIRGRILVLAGEILFGIGLVILILLYAVHKNDTWMPRPLVLNAGFWLVFGLAVVGLSIRMRRLPRKLMECDGLRFSVFDSWLVWLTSGIDRKSTRLNSSHSQISYAVFCLEKKK